MSTAEQDPTTVAPDEPPTTPTPTTPAFKFHDTTKLPDGTMVIVRLPNQFQHEDISLKASAAQARRMRQLRDPEADAYIVLESDMSDLDRDGDPIPLIDELIGREWWKDHLEAIKDVQERDEYKTVEDDMERLAELGDLAEADRPAEEYAELQRHVERYNAEVKAAREAREKPRRDAYADKDLVDLISDVREQRISTEGKQAFNRAFTIHEIALGTYRTAPHADGKLHPTSRFFQSADEVIAADPETLHILTTAFTELERQFNRGAVGND